MFDIVATGGTFDILHKGHYMLLLKAFEVGRQVIIGVSSDNYATLKKKKITNKYSIRQEKLKKFIVKSFVPTWSYGHLTHPFFPQNWLI